MKSYGTKKTCADCPTPSTCAKVGCIKKMIGDR